LTSGLALQGQGAGSDNQTVVRRDLGSATTRTLEHPGRRPMPEGYVAALALSGLLALVVITVGALATRSRIELTVVAAVASAPALFVVSLWGVRSPRDRSDYSD
jgi:hypothetical protein